MRHLECFQLNNLKQFADDVTVIVVKRATDGEKVKAELIDAFTRNQINGVVSHPLTDGILDVVPIESDRVLLFTETDPQKRKKISYLGLKRLLNGCLRHRAQAFIVTQNRRVIKEIECLRTLSFTATRHLSLFDMKTMEHS